MLPPIPPHLTGPEEPIGRPYEDILNLARGLMISGTEAMLEGRTNRGMIAIAQAQVLLYALDMEPTEHISNMVMPPEMFELFEVLTKKGAEWYESQITSGHQAMLDAFHKRHTN